MIYRIPNNDVEDKQSNYKQKVSFMSDRCFRMLLCGPSRSGRHFDKIYLFAKNLQRKKSRHLIDLFEPITEKAGYPIIEASNDKIIPLERNAMGQSKVSYF